jgi:hypothetical protein
MYRKFMMMLVVLLVSLVAVVHATWVFPDGSTMAVQDATRGSSGRFATFSIEVPSRGTYSLRIDDIVLEDYRFVPEDSVLSASIKVK